jgi:uncharacterized membrane protein
MTTTKAPRISRFDRTLRSVMWMDAFLSVAMVVICLIATPIVATVGVPQRIVFALGVASIVVAVLLAAFGAITAVALMVRMRAGDYALPPNLRVPLPGGMNPLT